MPDNPRKRYSKPDERVRRANRSEPGIKVRSRPVTSHCCMLDEILAGLSWFGG